MLPGILYEREHGHFVGAMAIGGRRMDPDP